jgi:hypothetical protein
VGIFAEGDAYEAALALEALGQVADFADAARALASLEQELQRLYPALARLTPKGEKARRQERGGARPG